MFYSHMKGHIEALLFASGEPLTVAKLAEVLQIDQEHVGKLIAELNADMDGNSRGLVIVEISGGFQLCTKPELAPVIEKLIDIQETRLSTAALETLAIVAFKQPVTKQEIEAIRGVKIDKLVSTLIDKGFIKELGRKEVIGRPILYGTTDDFLKHFGLKSLQDLPPIADLLPEQQP